MSAPDDFVDALSYVAAAFSPTGREVQAQAQMASARMGGKSAAIVQWGKAISDQIARESLFRTLSILGNSPFSVRHGIVQHPHKLMKNALAAMSPFLYKRWKQMSPQRRDAFIARVERQGPSGYHSHMREIYNAFKAEQVFHALKD